MKDFIIPTNDMDMGTPASKSTDMVTLSIDGFDVTVPEGTSVMRASAQAGIQVPKLCASDNLEAFGSCRLCVVEIEGRRGTPASCTTPVTPGMVVKTQSSKVKKIRKGVMELYISDHPLDCLTCAANGDCELQDMAGMVGLRDVRYEAPVNGSLVNHFEARSNLGEANAQFIPKDDSNPYFTYDPAKCIVCSRCVRACEEVQGTFALTIEGSGFNSRVSAGAGGDDFMSSDCVSCGACVQACPTATLQEKSVIEMGTPERSVVTTCAYCGVGCSFKAELNGDELVRMTPYKHGEANRGHSCVKGRFAWGYANHSDRILNPMIRDKVTDPWQEVSWDEAIAYSAQRLRDLQKKHGVKSIGGITSSRCTNEETYLVQKLIRSTFGNNNTDTCARVCHSPTGYGLKTAFGLIVIDPRRTDIVKSAHIEASHHLPLLPGTNVAVLSSIAHVIVTEGLMDEAFIRTRCDWDEFAHYAEFISEPRHAPEATALLTGVDAAELRAAARLFATGGNGSIYYGLGVTEHSQGSTTVMAIANLAMMTGNLGKNGVGVNPLRGQNNVQGACDMGSFPHELPGYRHVSDDATREVFEAIWGTKIDAEPGLRIPNMLDAAVDGTFRGIYIQGEDILQSDPDTKHVKAGLEAMECVIVHDLFLNETANYAHVFLPGSTFLEKDGTFTNAERRINRVRKVMAPKNGYADWEITMMLANAMGSGWTYTHPSQVMDEIAATTSGFANVNYEMLETRGSVQWPCNDDKPDGSPIMHIDGFARGKGQFIITEYVATDEKTGPRFPLLLTTGRILSQYNVGAQTRRTENTAWHEEDVLEIHPHDAEVRGVRDGQYVRLASRAGETQLRATITDRVSPGVVYTTFHHPDTQANVITTDYSDWATNCPEYKVTAVQVALSNGPSDWQEDYNAQAEQSRRILPAAE